VSQAKRGPMFLNWQFPARIRRVTMVIRYPELRNRWYRYPKRIHSLFGRLTQRIRYRLSSSLDASYPPMADAIPVVEPDVVVGAQPASAPSPPVATTTTYTIPAPSTTTSTTTYTIPPPGAPVPPVNISNLGRCETLPCIFPASFWSDVVVLNPFTLQISGPHLVLSTSYFFSCPLS
jgi:hypothetical protein